MYDTTDEQCVMMESNWMSHNGTGYYTENRYEFCEIGKLKKRCILVVEVDTIRIIDTFFDTR